MTSNDPPVPPEPSDEDRNDMEYLHEHVFLPLHNEALEGERLEREMWKGKNRDRGRGRRQSE